MGRGFLTGQIKSLDDLPAKDVRRHLPRFQPANFGKNMELVHRVRALADEKGCTAGQLAINWVRCLSRKPGFPRIVPIPGASTVERVRENARIVELTEGEMERIDEIVKAFVVQGDRYHAAGQKYVNG